MHGIGGGNKCLLLRITLSDLFPQFIIKNMCNSAPEKYLPLQILQHIKYPDPVHIYSDVRLSVQLILLTKVEMGCIIYNGMYHI